MILPNFAYVPLLAIITISTCLDTATVTNPYNLVQVVSEDTYCKEKAYPNKVGFLFIAT